MEKRFDFLFTFLEKEKILINKQEFLFQLQSHPDYPTLLSISDTLTFFKIQNGVFRVNIEEIELLPNQFITLLREVNSPPKYYLIKKQDYKYYYSPNEKFIEISQDELTSRWTSIILLINKEESEYKKESAKNWKTYLMLLSMFLFALNIFILKPNEITFNIFFIFPTIGIMLSMAALKDLFGTQNKLINSLCNLTSTTNCTSVINSKKWKILDYINFSDLSIIFFSFQILYFIFSAYTNGSNDFFSIQSIITLLSIPVILTSIYYQKVIEKKWCPICIMISTIIICEFLYLIFAEKFILYIYSNSIIACGFIFSFVILLWSIIKNTLLKLKRYRENELKSNRFERNYNNFKKILVSTEKIEFPSSLIKLGNINSKTVITLISHPFCIYCEEVHTFFEDILNFHKENILVNIIFKINISDYDEQKNTFFNTFLNIYKEKGQEAFRESMREWFESKSVEKWNKKYSKLVSQENNAHLLENHNDWCISKNFTFTPAIFVNGYEFPNSYDRTNIKFFINDIVEDIF